MLYLAAKPPFENMEGTGEALGIMTLVILIIGLFFLLENMKNNSPVLRLVIAGISIYLVSITNVTILVVCFVTLALANLFRIIYP